MFLGVDEVRVKWDKKWKTAKFLTHSRFAEKAYQWLKKRGFSKVVDLGCGNGRDSVYFATHGLQVLAIDWSREALKTLETEAQKANVANLIQTSQQNLARLKLTPCSVEAVFANLSLQYFEDQTMLNIMSAIYQGLVNRGLLFIRVKSNKDRLSRRGTRVGQGMREINGVRQRFLSVRALRSSLSNFHVLELQETTGLLPSLSMGRNYQSKFIEVIAEKR